MNITSIDTNRYNVSMQGNWWKKVGQKVLDRIPERAVKDGGKNSKDKWDKIRYILADPMWNRGIVGATALITQPAIDYYNHRVDDETRTVSRNRTIAKIIAGTLVGMFVVRGPVYQLVRKMTRPFGLSKFSTLLLPKKYKLDLMSNPNKLENYRKALSMLLALVAMSYTNFKLDAPLTNYLTNRLNEKSKVKSAREEVKNG